MNHSSGSAFSTERIVLRSAAAAEIELFIEFPDGSDQRPAVLLVHGHQFPDPPGGARYAEDGHLHRMVARGYVAAAVSQPGYGASQGPPDYCGPRTQAAIRVALAHLRGLANVDGDRMALYGLSRGATASAMVLVEEPTLAAAVLVSGMYDLGETFPTGLPILDENILQESGLSEKSLNVRSVLRHTDRIVTPILLVHGAQDDRAPIALARKFAKRLREAGVPAREAIFGEQGHGLPWSDIDREAVPFLADVFSGPTLANS